MFNILDFGLASSDEICQTLGHRLKGVRLTRGWTQAELARRAGVSRGTIVTLEGHGQTTLASLVRVVQVLGLENELQSLFVQPPPRSIAELERRAAPRQRAPRQRPPRP
ncbi:helix-turn-helix domain-containing protein [Sphaerotilus sp.]|uniref:helix-turn-helix domain-containing protein n=1 Tax=Sphaerotilus sp. TaxID=2093942 RepID=UPI002ACE11EA|nr:helix-turn-helix domain-containing protein [Sphaerotilus sp.]MDZ7856106.1 helix-turn-helix domain-containing protein [Sphaerotilus sp.]